MWTETKITVLYDHTVHTIDGRRATMCAVKENDSVYIGAAVCSKKDQFVKGIGRTVAKIRAFNHEGVPDNVLDWYEFNTFVLRVCKYFKDVPYENIHMWRTV